jgi:pyridoxine kinase
MRERVVPAAQVITPNQFELEALSGRTVDTHEDLLAAADVVRDLGPETVLVTSVVLDDSAPDTIEMVAVDSAAAWSVSTPLLPRSFTGGGDLTAATFLAQLLTGAHLARALERTAAVVFGVLRITVDLGRSELALIPAQQELVVPAAHFSAERLR